MRVIPITTAWPAREPVTLEQLRGQVRVDDTTDDAMLRGYLAAARSHVERLMGRPIVPRPMTATFYRWPGCGYGFGGFGGGYGAGYGPGPYAGDDHRAWGDDRLTVMVPVLTVDAVTYTAADGSTQSWASGQWVARTSPGGVTHIRPATGQDWPVLGSDPVIMLTVTAGFDAVPPAIAEAILLLASHFYLNREEVLTGARITAIQLPLGVADLIAPYRWQWIG